ncbi:hypothetical protein [Dactylosporangium sp. NPDC051541]|uniref:hypothetical protein n=1 Tax=Dactylosporangium sp. NPDC051541 TaxID=3363977 RepID=UPI0037949278
MGHRERLPPRAVAPGDVVAAYSEELGEWTAAQVTNLDPAGRTTGVLELDWSGPEPSSLADLGELRELTLTHHAHSGRLSYRNYEWLLPRGYKVLGNAPLLEDGKSNSYSGGWYIGDQLASQRRWDRGERITHHPGRRSFFGHELAELVARGEPLTELWNVSVDRIDAADGHDLAGLFPNAVRLRLAGNLGLLSGADGLNRLRKLRSLFVVDLFGMVAGDCLSTAAVPDLAQLELHSVPAEYAAAMKKVWVPEAANGTFVETVERDELFDALDAIVDYAEAEHGRAFAAAREQLAGGVNDVRDW